MIHAKHFTAGKKVRYYYEDDKIKPINGIIKSLHPINESLCWVVFKCNNDWGNYTNYTAELCEIDQLKIGWE